MQVFICVNIYVSLSVRIYGFKWFSVSEQNTDNHSQYIDIKRSTNE